MSNIEDSSQPEIASDAAPRPSQAGNLSNFFTATGESSSNVPIPVFKTPLGLDQRKDSRKRKKNEKQGDTDAEGYHSVIDDTDTHTDSETESTTSIVSGQNTSQATGRRLHHYTALKNENVELKSQLQAKDALIQSLVEEIKKLTSRLEQTERSVADMDVRVANIEQQGQLLSTGPSQTALPAQGAPVKDSTQSKLASNDWTELNRRLKKQNNIIVFGISESSSADTSLRDDYDRKTVSSLLKEIGRTDSDFISLKRLYKRQSTGTGNINTPIASGITKPPAPILLRLKEPSLRNKILYAAKSLENSSNFKKVSIRPDLTKQQKDEEVALRAQRDTKNNDAVLNKQPFRYIIRGGEIVEIPASQYRKNTKPTTEQN